MSLSICQQLFSSFFFLFERHFFADVAKPRSRAALIRQKIHPLAWWIFIISSYLHTVNAFFYFFDFI